MLFRKKQYWVILPHGDFVFVHLKLGIEEERRKNNKESPSSSQKELYILWESLVSISLNHLIALFSSLFSFLNSALKHLICSLSFRDSERKPTKVSPHFSPGLLPQQLQSVTHTQLSYFCLNPSSNVGEKGGYVGLYLLDFLFFIINS